MRYTRETKVGMFVLTAFAILAFMGFYLGVYRFDNGNYVKHTLYFKDINGLIKKSEVKIAGVPVGWVENLALDEHDGMCVRADIMIDKAYLLYQDAYGVVRQEGLIGPIFLELVPGTPNLPQLTHELSRSKKQPEQVSMDTLMRSLQDVAQEMKEIVCVVKKSIATDEQTDRISDVLSGVDQIIKQLHSEVLPAFTESVRSVAQVVNRDFSHFAHRIDLTANMLDGASDTMLKGFEEVKLMAHDINQGKGFIGNMMRDEEMYKNINRTTRFLSDACDRFSHLFFTYDGHVEDMFQRASSTCFKNAKGFFNVRIYPRPDYFYLIGVTTSQQGYITRTLTVQDYVDNCLNQICNASELPEWARYEYIYSQEKKRVKRNAFKVNLQFGKLYKNIALRAGLFEGTGGFSLDVFVPYKHRHGLISTFQMYDFRGQNRLCDERPHLKWINRIFIFDTVYIAFGLDDFVSKHDKSVFLGAGFRFGDGDLKYFLPNFVGVS